MPVFKILSINHTIQKFMFICLINYEEQNSRQDYVLEFFPNGEGGVIHKEGRLFDSHHLYKAIWNLAVELKSTKDEVTEEAIGDEVSGLDKSCDRPYTL